MLTEENIKKMMKNANNMQEKIQQIQEEIKKTEIIGESGAGLIKIIMNGSYTCKKIHIDTHLWKEKNKKIIEELIASAINDSIRKIIKMQKEKMLNISENMNFKENI